MKIKLGFIGIGAMGLSHLKAMHQHPGGQAEVVAVCSRSEENLKKALEIAPQARVFQSEDELIQSDVEAIFVSTPNFTHASLAEKIIATGKHLFLEKPCGITRDDGARLLRLAEQSRGVLMIGHEFRYSPYFQKVKALIDAGEIGQPRMVWTREFRGPFQKKSGEWIQDDRLSGGCLVDKNCHHFDLMNWWAGARPKRVSAFGGNAVNRVIAGEHQVHDHATVSFEYENQVRGTLQLCMFALDFPYEDLEMGVVGEEGMLHTRISKIEILQWRRGRSQKEPVIHSVPAPSGSGWGGHLGFNEIHEAFLQAITTGQKPLTTVRDCLDGTLLAIAAEESIKTGQIIEL